MMEFNEQDIAEACERCNIPLQMRGGITRYLCQRIAPGHFLRAVFENDLLDSISRADDGNRAAIESYARFLYNEMPIRGTKGAPWGSPYAVDQWLEGGQNDGK